MSAGINSDRTPATLGEIAARVRFALDRYPLFRKLNFDVMPTLRNGNGTNWAVMFRSGGAELDEAEEIVRDIQDAYQLETETVDFSAGPLRWVQRARAGGAVANRAMART